jgi:hypothetical protein
MSHVLRCISICDPFTDSPSYTELVENVKIFDSPTEEPIVRFFYLHVLDHRGQLTYFNIRNFKVGLQ